MMLTVIAWSFQRGPNAGMVWALIGGLAIDLASGAPFGISPVPLMLAAIVAGAGYNRIYRSNLVLPALITLLAVALYQTLYLALLVLTGQPVNWQVGLWQVGAPLLLLHWVLMPAVYFGAAWLSRLTKSSHLHLG